VAQRGQRGGRDLELEYGGDAVAVNITGRGHGRRCTVGGFVTVLVPRRLEHREVELVPDRILRERGRTCRALVVRLTATRACRQQRGRADRKAPSSPQIRFAFLPILSSWSEASLILLRFMYSMNAGIETADIAPAIPSEIMMPV
jgi:hypothetical protein